MWKPVTEKDFPKFTEKVKEINNGYKYDDLDPIKPFNIHVEITSENGRNNLRIVDYNEELTWDGMLTESTMEKLEQALKEDTNDPNAYFDCMSCSEWLADWEGRDRYDKEAMELDMHIGILDAFQKYIADNGKHKYWTRKQKDDFDRTFNELVKVVNGIIDSWEE